MNDKSSKLERWKSEIELARTSRKIYLRHWLYYEQVFDDNLWGLSSGRFESAGRRNTQNDAGFIPSVNEADPIINSILPRIGLYSPVFEVRATFNDPRSRFSALAWETAAERFYENLNMDDVLEDIVLDALILGGGVHKVGIYSEIESSGYLLGDDTSDADVARKLLVFSGCVDPKDVLWDYRVKSWKDSRWFAEEIVKSVEEVKKSELYTNTSRLTGTINPAEGIEGVKRKERIDYKGELVRLIEIHDLVENKIITIADGHDKILREDEDYDIELYNQLVFAKTRPRRVWGKSIIQSIEEHMIALSKVYYYLIAHSKSAGLRKLLVESSMMTKEAVKALKSNKDMELVPMDGVIQGEPVRELKFTGPGNDWYNNFNIIDGVIRMISGVTQQERGKHEAGVRTAFEIAKLAQSSDVRNMHRIKKLNAFMANVMKKVLILASGSLSVTAIAQIIGLPPEYAFLITPFDEMRLTIKFGSTAIEARQNSMNRVMAFVQLASSAGLQINPKGFIEVISEALGMEWKEKDLLMQAAAGGGEGSGVARPPAANISQSAAPSGEGSLF